MNIKRYLPTLIWYYCPRLRYDLPATCFRLFLLLRRKRFLSTLLDPRLPYPDSYMLRLLFDLLLSPTQFSWKDIGGRCQDSCVAWNNSNHRKKPGSCVSNHNAELNTCYHSYGLRTVFAATGFGTPSLLSTVSTTGLCKRLQIWCKRLQLIRQYEFGQLTEAS